jgi:quinoprotein glucose dehydrogenase
VDAAVRSTKFGRFFILDREIGAPLFPVEERPVPPSDVPGEQAWPMQPQPLPFSHKLHRQFLQACQDCLSLLFSLLRCP